MLSDLTHDAAWWRQAVVYQVYPRSFADSNGDGLGDIAGITSRADYLKDLGIDAVWLSSFYPSALADGGYDVADYRNVDPKLGTLEDFDDMVEALHARGIRVVVDIVPNHTSDLHPWFQAALAAGPGSPERERYHFRKGLGPDGNEPPSDWQSHFGEVTWTQVEDGEWYLHTFAKEQADLNWDHPDVRADFITTIRFWSDRGVDGFRIDVAHMLTKNMDFEVLPTWAELEATPIDGNHPTLDRDDVQEIYAQWRKVFNEYDPPRTAVAESWVASDRVPRYANPNSLGQSFNFDLLEADFNATHFHDIVTHNLDLAKKSGSSTPGCSPIMTLSVILRGMVSRPLAAGRMASPWSGRVGHGSTAAEPILNSIARGDYAGRAPPLSLCWACPARPTFIRARSWAFMRSLRFRRSSAKILGSSIPTARMWVAMAAVSRFRGRLRDRRSVLATMALTSRNRLGSLTLR